jgi:hypothetical protein
MIESPTAVTVPPSGGGAGATETVIGRAELLVVALLAVAELVVGACDVERDTTEAVAGGSGPTVDAGAATAVSGSG